MARRRRRGGGRRRRRRGGGLQLSTKEKRNLVIASAALGYIEENTEFVTSLPGYGGTDPLSPVKRRLLYGVALHFIGKSVGGSMGKYADITSAAFLMRGAWDLGAAKFTLTGDDSGVDVMDADEVRGTIDCP